MKKIFTFLFSIVLCGVLFAQKPDFNLYGFAAENGGTTGGNAAGAVTHTVTTYDELAAALTREKGSTEPRIVKVVGTIEVPGGGEAIEVGSDITLFGADGNAMISQIQLYIKNAHNIIIRNLRFTAVGSNKGSDSDCISIATTSSNRCNNIWIDHCEFFNVEPIRNPSASLKDKYDGLLDIKKTSEYITISWCYFHDHYKAILVGYTASDTYDRKITMHHNRFERVNSRVPSYRGGTGHVYNNSYLGTTDSEGYFGTGVNAREGACLLVENNYFEKMTQTIYCAIEDVKTEGYAYGTGNIFVDCQHEFTANGCTSFTPPYEVNQDAAADLPLLLKEWAGSGKLNSYDDYGNEVSAEGKPTVSIKSPADNAVYEFPASVTMEVVASDEDGTIEKVEIYDGADLATTLTEAPFVCTLDQLQVGEHILSAKAIDNDGKFATASVMIVVEGIGGGGDVTAGESFFPQANLDENQYYWFNESNKTHCESMIADQTIVLNNSVTTPESTTKLQPTAIGANESGTKESGRTGYIGIAKGSGTAGTEGGSVVFALPSCALFEINFSTTGSQYLKVFTSKDNQNWAECTDLYINKGKKGITTHNLTSGVSSTSPIYVKVANYGTGSIMLHGVKISKAISSGIDNMESDPLSIYCDGDEIICNRDYLTIEVFDAAGKLVKKGNDIAGLPNGNYLVRVQEANGKISTLKLKR